MERGRVPIDRVSAPPETQSRVGDLDQGYVDELVDALRRKERLPPIRVVRTEDDLVVVDGFHRLAAAILYGARHIDVEVVAKGDLRTAIWCAASSNAAHGLRRSRGDVKRAILMAKRVRPDASDREIARHVRCSRKYVATVVKATSPNRDGDSRHPQMGTSAREGQISPPSDVNEPTAIEAPDEAIEDVPPGGVIIEPDPVSALIAQAELEAEPVIAALRSAIRLARKIGAEEGPMRSAAQYLAPELRKLRSSFELALPRPCPREGCNDACGVCHGKGWVRARSLRAAR